MVECAVLALLHTAHEESVLCARLCLYTRKGEYAVIQGIYSCGCFHVDGGVNFTWENGSLDCPLKAGHLCLETGSHSSF